MAITVLIADDQAMVRQGFGALLAAQPDISVVGDAENGKVAVGIAVFDGSTSKQRDRQAAQHPSPLRPKQP